ncbi:PcfK-like family protein [Anaerocolumna xylanovorans]|uniref:PcfK-like protein n=1 Tax=Anaerocolumna xylanovorans DSM 12503 TaxID=1121345 RepID=A0A1M7YNB3_9FIRM|nr:PcfK-like family protein [Anaerocolumna xylanovorans]SHO54134.1 PcfK-like protein [Anaerocolumna xylanovorans DSM 12503]
MGVFSEIAMEEENEQEEINPFSLEHIPEEEAQEKEAFEDEEEQQAEADAAAEVLANLEEKSGSSLYQKKKEHEEKEAQRKAEWEAKRQAKLEAEQIAWENAVAMSDDELLTASLKRVGTDVERITRRNMKMCVTEYIQTRCLEDVDFARQVMHPRKNMINCFKYINRRAFEFVKQEMEDNEVKSSAEGYGSDIPDDLCYQWAEEYFLDMDAKEDKDKEEDFVPKPYYGGASSTKSSKNKKAPEKKPVKKAEPHKEEDVVSGQMSFIEQLPIMEVLAG